MKVPVTLLALVLAGSAFAAMPAGAAQEAAEKKDAPAAKKETQWQGNVIALSSITLNDNVTLIGRALARNGAVTLGNNNVITLP